LFLAYDLKGKPHLMIPFSRNEDVVIREEIFRELELKLPLSSQHKSTALWGLGGSGYRIPSRGSRNFTDSKRKTQVALEFAYRRYEQCSCSVFWVHADGYASFLNDYSSIARLAKLSNKLENEDLMRDVRAWIESQSNWLLVLDNADDLQHFGEGYGSCTRNDSGNLYSFIPQGASGTILWTTRDERILGGLVSPKQGINITSMNAREALALLVNLSNLAVATEDDSLKVSELIERLGNLPLAISQAAAYIRRTSMSITEYVEKLKKEKSRWKLLDESGFDRHRRTYVPNSVMKTWQISFDHIRLESPCAYRILHILAYFNNQDIPFELIRAAAKSNTRQEVASEEKSPENHVHTEMRGMIDDSVDQEEGEEEDDDAIEAATRLKEFSLLRLQHAKNGLRIYSMHKLVQEATRCALNNKTGDRGLHFSKTALEIMLQLFPNSDYTTWHQCEILLPHAVTVSEWPEVSREHVHVANLLTKVSGYLHDQGRSGEKEAIDQKTYKLRREVLGERHPETIRSMSNLAATYYQQGRFKEDEEISLKVLRLWTEVLGERHPYTIESMASLAATYYQQGRSKEAEGIKVQVLELRKEVLGERHPDTIKSKASLAASYHQQGRSKEAEDVKNEVLMLQKEMLGERHPDTVYGMAELATTYFQQGRLTEAEEIYVEVLEQRKEMLGERHPDTLISMSDLATVLQDQGRYEESETMHRWVLAGRETALGSKHPETLASANNLALVLQDQGRYEESETMHRWVLAGRETALGSEHPETLASANSLTLVLRDQGRYADAEDVHRHTLDVEEKVFGVGHPSTLTSISNSVSRVSTQGLRYCSDTRSS
jgi:tetratricopeptide (TPR) repeat protein